MSVLGVGGGGGVLLKGECFSAFLLRWFNYGAGETQEGEEVPFGVLACRVRCACGIAPVALRALWDWRPSPGSSHCCNTYVVLCHVIRHSNTQVLGHPTRMCWVIQHTGVAYPTRRCCVNRRSNTQMLSHPPLQHAGAVVHLPFHHSGVRSSSTPA